MLLVTFLTIMNILYPGGGGHISGEKPVLEFPPTRPYYEVKDEYVSKGYTEIENKLRAYQAIKRSA